MLRIASLSGRRPAACVQWATGSLSRASMPVGSSGTPLWIRSLSYWEKLPGGNVPSSADSKPAATTAEAYLSQKLQDKQARESKKVTVKGYERDSIRNGWDRDRKKVGSGSGSSGGDREDRERARARARELVDSFSTQAPKPFPSTAASPRTTRVLPSSQPWETPRPILSPSSSSSMGGVGVRDKVRELGRPLRLPAEQPAEKEERLSREGFSRSPPATATVAAPAKKENQRQPRLRRTAVAASAQVGLAANNAFGEDLQTSAVSTAVGAGSDYAKDSHQQRDNRGGRGNKSPKPSSSSSSPFGRNARSKEMDLRTAGLPGKMGKGQEGPDDYFFKKRRLTKAAAGTRKVDAIYENERETEHVRGFLEINPFVCTGCGAPFQAKAEGEPGYLTKEMMREHRTVAFNIKDRQEAIRTVEATGLALDSQAAEELLEAAGCSAELIKSVRAMGRKKEWYTKEKDGKDTFVGAEVEEATASTAAIGAEASAVQTKYSFIEEDPYETETLEASAMAMTAADVDTSSGVPAGADAAALAATLEAEEWSDDDELEFDEMANDSDLDSPVAGSFQQRMSVDTNTGAAYTDDGADSALQMFEEMHSVGADNYLHKQYPEKKEGKVKYINHKKHKAQQLAVLLGEEEGEAGGGTGELSGKEAMEAAAAHLKVCQRCFRLHQYGHVDNTLRPGFSSHELLTAEHFTKLLGVIRETSCVVLCLVDIFDLEGSILKDLKHIAGKNPVLIAANKVDLIPKNVSNVRLTNWIQDEIKFLCGFKSPREKDQERHAEAKDLGWVRHRAASDESGILRRQNIHLISCSNGQGMKALMDSALAIAKGNGQKIYVMGTANVGKSSFINRLLETSYTDEAGKGKGKKKPIRTNVPLATVSNLPGTTLNFIKIHIPTHAGISVFDTPGLLNTSQLTTKLTPEELRQVIPTTPIVPTTIRVLEGKTVLIGGLAQVELLEVRVDVHVCTYVCSIVRVRVRVRGGGALPMMIFRPKHSSADLSDDNFAIFDLI